ncbi:DUF1499 domain-containing protein [Aurantiacibacter spongiae]|nr:DUF1499 domain-containing protein [Aurantiacibacter spongiae]
MAETTEHDRDAGETHGKPRSPVVKWMGAFALGGALLFIVVAIVALTLARYGIVDKLGGFITFMKLLFPALVTAVVAAIALVIGYWRKVRPVWQAAAGLVLSLGLLIVMYFAVIQPGTSAPAMHDITTDVDDPPQFVALALRPDNLTPFDSMEEWRAAHRQNYPMIEPVVIDRPPEQVLAQARALAEDRGWTIAYYDVPTGHMEATAYAGYIRFMDDVIVEVTPIADGSSRVDMRSVSRVGVSDLGYNAARVQEFLHALQRAG